MARFYDAPPSIWKYHLSAASVPKDGSLFEESFYLEADKPISYWSQLYEFEKPLKVELEALRSEGRIIVSVLVDGNAKTSCTRCLEFATIQINSKTRSIFSLKQDEYSNEEDGENSDLSEDELIFIDSWDETIDLIPIIWETLLSALHVKVLCNAECKGLCPHCGEDLNKSKCDCKKETTDPRFDVLRTLIKEEE